MYFRPHAVDNKYQKTENKHANMTWTHFQGAWAGIFVHSTTVVSCSMRRNVGIELACFHIISYARFNIEHSKLIKMAFFVWRIPNPQIKAITSTVINAKSMTASDLMMPGRITHFLADRIVYSPIRLKLKHAWMNVAFFITNRHQICEPYCRDIVGNKKEMVWEKEQSEQCVIIEGERILWDSDRVNKANGR